jgi:hypothetical protein
MDMSLKNFKLDYGELASKCSHRRKADSNPVDLYLMHFPYAYAMTEGYGTQRTADGKVELHVSARGVNC